MNSTSVIGLPETLRNLAAFRDYVAKGAGELVARYALLIEARAKRNLEGGRSGPRRIDTGFLRASIHTRLTTQAAEVISGANYSVHVHNGTSRMAPNYYLQEALDYHREAFIRDLIALINAWRPSPFPPAA